MNSTLNSTQLLYGNRIELDKEQSFWRKVKFATAFFLFFALLQLFFLKSIVAILLPALGTVTAFILFFLRGKVHWTTISKIYFATLSTALFVFTLVSGGTKSHAVALLAAIMVSTYWFLGKKVSRMFLGYISFLICTIFFIEFINEGPLLDPLSRVEQLVFNMLIDLSILLSVSNDVRAIDLQSSLFQKKLQNNSDELVQFGEELSQTNEEINAQKEEIESQRDEIERHHMKLSKSHEHVTDSIRYAKTIQMALLTSQDEMEKIFADVSVLFKPRDHVSGDFYFARKFENKTIMVVGDCTGHGVPGALLSMVGLEALDRLEELPESPAELLEQLDGYFFEKLRQSHRDGNKDGMDISVVFLDNENNLSYAGAKGKAILLDSNGILPLKSTNRSIGGSFIRRRNFEVTKMKIQPDTMICLYTDGYVDQNGANGKIGTLKFREILQNYYLKYTKDCIEGLDSYLKAEMEGYDQRDDITVLLAVNN
ncbi:PP2C family protein-serine/threonine phosphatase [Flammeovirga agarivorans]|uniref:SpoIIE family protein phosphatase n=1 Tax=Flammeovirga agarivorans TaxID=2726742 RepID=A0A7X8SG45_9BACT|nr:SpoIIE family protein phosphatase [Flammeovirga agarivorans]NLR89625.1 SpoIIE family protein phosphatase [Flammeovirga agarivorans]